LEPTSKVLKPILRDLILLPPIVEHSPQRYPNTVGLVIERQRTPQELDACTWYCENCDTELYRAKFHLGDIVEQLPKLMQSFYDSLGLRTCKKCGHVMEPPKLKCLWMPKRSANFWPSVWCRRGTVLGVPR